MLMGRRKKTVSRYVERTRERSVAVITTLAALQRRRVVLIRSRDSKRVVYTCVLSTEMIIPSPPA